MTFDMARFLDLELRVLAKGMPEFYDTAPAVYGPLQTLLVDELVRRQRLYRAGPGPASGLPGQASAVLTVSSIDQLRAAVRALVCNRLAMLALESEAGADFFAAAINDLLVLATAQYEAAQQPTLN